MTQNQKSNVSMVYTGDNITLVLDGKPYSISKETPGFDDLLTLVKSKADASQIRDFIEKDVKRLQDAANALGDNVAINVQAGVVTYKGQEIRNSLTERMLTMLEEGFDLAPMNKFLENLMSNPSMRAVNELYSFLEKGNLPITEDGCFLAYKAVRHDFKDIHSGTMDNSVGRIVQMPRNAVDDDKDRTCSYGLHFCSVDYLKHFANRDGNVVILKINPRDVVSIPADYNDTKGRCCKYEVIELFKDFDFSNPDRNVLGKSSVYEPEISPYGLPTSTPV